jgi:hypothetical protein
MSGDVVGLGYEKRGEGRYNHDEGVTRAERGARGQQHLEDAKDGLQKREGQEIQSR